MAGRRGSELQHIQVVAIIAKREAAQKLADDPASLTLIQCRVAEGVPHEQIARELVGDDELAQQRTINAIRQGVTDGLFSGFSHQVLIERRSQRLREWRTDPETGQWRPEAVEHQRRAAVAGGYALKRYVGQEEEIAGLLTGGLNQRQTAEEMTRRGTPMSPSAVQRLVAGRLKPFLKNDDE